MKLYEICHTIGQISKCSANLQNLCKFVKLLSKLICAHEKTQLVGDGVVGLVADPAAGLACESGCGFGCGSDTSHSRPMTKHGQPMVWGAKWFGVQNGLGCKMVWAAKWFGMVWGANGLGANGLGCK